MDDRHAATTHIGVPAARIVPITTLQDFHMTASICLQPPKSEWFLEPQSRTLTAAMWAAAKVAAGLQNLRGNCCSEGFGILMYHRVAENTRGCPGAHVKRDT